MENLIYKLLLEIGENPEREGLRNTPKRVKESLKYLTKGYNEDPEKIINGAIYESENSELVLMRDIDFYSMCEHHLLPFFGKCHIGYITNKKIIGLSKLARIVEIYSKRLQVQERLTNEISSLITKKLEPKGVAVVIKAYHLCTMMRGVEKPNSMAVTSSMTGEFKSDESKKSWFLELIK